MCSLLKRNDFRASTTTTTTPTPWGVRFGYHFEVHHLICVAHCHRAPSLHCNGISLWLGAYLDWSLMSLVLLTVFLNVSPCYIEILNHTQYWFLHCVQYEQTTLYTGAQYDINELVQEKRNSMANALELHLSCTNPSIYVTHRAIMIKLEQSVHFEHQTDSLYWRTGCGMSSVSAWRTLSCNNDSQYPSWMA